MMTIRGNMVYRVGKNRAKHVGNAILPNSGISFIDGPVAIEEARRVFRKVRKADDDRLTLRFWAGIEHQFIYIYVDGKLIGYFKGRK